MNSDNQAVIGAPNPSPSVMFTSDDIYKLIADGAIVFDLYHDDISNTHRSLVFRDIASMECHRHLIDCIPQFSNAEAPVFSIMTGTDVEYEGRHYKVVLPGEANVIMEGLGQTIEFSLDILKNLFDAGKVKIRNEQETKNSDEVPAVLNVLSPQQLERALKRRKALEDDKYNPETFPFSKRTFQRAKKSIREAGGNALETVMALVTHEDRRGNRLRKIPVEVISVMDAAIRTVYNKPAGGSQRNAYMHFCGECFEKGLKPCSEKTFLSRLKELSSIGKREGRRREYQATRPIVWYLYADEPIHGARPFQYVHIDHTPLDLLLTHPQGKTALGKAWCSLAIDADTRAVVGFSLSFEPPSYRSCMMVIRDIVRRHRRMPEMIVTDNGKEFHSEAFQRVCTLYGTHLRFRPSAQPRHGSVMERVFGTTNTQFIHNLQGNTKLMRHVRTVTKSVSPSNFVEWTLPALHGALDYYASVVYGKEPHPAHNCGPDEYLSSRLVETGVRRNRWVQFDQTLMIETCPGPAGGDTRVIDGMRGVKVSNIWYWNDVFANACWRGTTAVVRVDPWDIRWVYVLLGNHWYPCNSKLLSSLKKYTLVELRYAFEELARKKGKSKPTPERCAEWLRLYDPKNFDPRLRMQQSEARYLYDGLGMSDVSGFRLSTEDSQPGVREIPQNHETFVIGATMPQLPLKAEGESISHTARKPTEPNDEDEPDEYELY